MIKFGRIFLIAFIFGLLIIPLFHINTAEITEQENRTLAKFPTTIKKDKPNYEFGKEFESWLGDRFWGRDQLIHYKSVLEYIFEKYYQKNGRVKGKDGWLFFQQNKNALNLTQSSINSLQKFKQYCDSKKIKLFVILQPASRDIYSENYPLEYDSRLNARTMQFLDKTNISIINSIPALKKAKEFKTFFKKDHHWTDYGALITYKEFEKMFRKEYPSYQVLNENDFNLSFVDQKDYERDGVSINSFCKGMALPDFLCPSEEYPYYQYKGNVVYEEHEKLGRGIQKYINKNGYPLRVLMISSSFGGAFKIFLTATFKDVMTINTNSLHFGQHPLFKPFKRTVQDYHPDVIILLLSSSRLKNFMDGF